ncbi:acetate--CoA ligase family protein [Gottfriedia sp. NPDC057991]|uniref:acetate--CoA ligase family protein n=1 Tax=Gottfriedia sp. NPDC057991 TaxID=3346298 RepID=UPI0036DA3F27
MKNIERPNNENFLEKINLKRKKELQICNGQFDDEFRIEFEDEACQAAKQIGYPVVMKMLTKEFHLDLADGIVKSNIQNENELRKNYSEMMKEVIERFPKVSIDGVLIKKLYSRQNFLSK